MGIEDAACGSAGLVRTGYVRECLPDLSVQGQSTLRAGSPAVDALYRTLPTSGLRLRVQPILLPEPVGALAGEDDGGGGR